MSTSLHSTLDPQQSETSAQPVGFNHLLHAEWTKFRTVRGWVVGLIIAAVVTVLVGSLSALGSSVSCAGGPDPAGGTGTAGRTGTAGGTDPGGGGGCRPSVPPLGPNGEAVSDNFTFVHQSLTGDGTITVAVTSFTGMIPVLPTGEIEDVPAEEVVVGPRPGLVPWAKAGLVIKDGIDQGSSYAAIMVTGDNGIRMQFDYTQDVAGSPTAATEQWLRLTRSGDTITGEESTDRISWTKVGTVNLAGLPTTVQAGMFVASPEYEITDQSFGESRSTGGPSQATATFDHLELQNGAPDGEWISGAVGGGGGMPIEPVTVSNGEFTISGSGDIAPRIGGPGPNTVERNGIGTFAGLIVMIVIGTTFITAEYRRGLIRTTLAATQARGRVLAAKALVLGAAGLVTGLIAAGVCIWVLGWLQRQNGISVIPVPWLTQLRIVVGTGAVFALVAVMALAFGTLLRRGAGAVAIVIVVVVLPYILAVASVLPVGAAQWLLRLTPAAGFAIQQSIPEYSQVAGFYAPSTGYFPLAPLGGLGVLLLWTAAVLAVAIAALRRRDA